MSTIVCKFGGTSCADAQCILKVAAIIQSDPNRKFIVLSAPGKRFATDTKITDMLYTCHNQLLTTGNCAAAFKPIADRFLQIADQLNIADLQPILTQTQRQIAEYKNLNFTISRGEYLNAICIAKYLNLPFIDAKTIIFFNKDGSLNEKKTYKAIQTATKSLNKAIIPGFYGSDANGNIQTFSRGGSDITGAIVSRAVSATLYENWTDVNGFLTADPALIPNAKPVQTLSFQELRELAYMGATVLHADCIFPLNNTNTPIQIKNTFQPEVTGTTILPLHLYNAFINGNTATATLAIAKNNIATSNKNAKNAVTAIAGKKNFMLLNIQKPIFTNKTTAIAKILRLLKSQNIKFEHITSSIDTLTFIVESPPLSPQKLQWLQQKLESITKPSTVNILQNTALIAIVGHEISKQNNIATQALIALSSSGITAQILNQSAAQINLIIGVNAAEYSTAINALYIQFFNQINSIE